MSQVPPPRPAAFDPRPLLAEVSREEAKAWAVGFRAAQGLPAGGGPGPVVAGVFGGILLIFGLIVAAGVATASRGGGLTIAIVALVIVGGGVAISVPTAIAARRNRERHWYRMAGFAAANGLEYRATIPTPQLPGMIFGLGDDRKTTDALRGTTPRFVEFGDYSYTTTQSDGKNTRTVTHRWGYVAIRLGVPLPNIVLDATGNNGLFGSNLPVRPAGRQRLSLEGDFDKYFSLYCPEGYETDALYLFTPDVMARFIDNAALLDVEIVDDWILLYRQGGLATEDPQTWAWLFGVVGVLLDKLSRWGRWRDDRLAALAAASGWASGPAPAAAAAPAPIPAAAHQQLPFAPPTPPPPSSIAAPLPLSRRPIGVAEPGRRLRRRFPVGVLVVLGIFVVGFVLTVGFIIVGGLLAAFSR